jgi:hypothetical protein
VDTQTDENNCGACGVMCTGGNQCTGGACGCPPGLKSCGNQCTNTDVDRNNCGACGTVCANGQACLSGACSAPGLDGGLDSGLTLPDAGKDASLPDAAH